MLIDLFIELSYNFQKLYLYHEFINGSSKCLQANLFVFVYTMNIKYIVDREWVMDTIINPFKYEYYM